MNQGKLQHHLLDVINKKPRVCILTRDGLDAACFRLRLGDALQMMSPVFETFFYKNSAQLMPNGQFPFENDDDLIAFADLFVVQRAFPSPAYKPLLQKIVDSGKPIIYEVDDWLIGMPESHPMYEEFNTLFPVVEWLLPHCAAIITATEALAKKFAKYNNNISVVPNRLARARLPAVVNRNNDVVTIGFAGTGTHKKDLESISKALMRIYYEYAGQVRFVFWGDVPEAMVGKKGASHIAQFLPYSDYLPQLSNLKIDIGIAPLRQGDFNEGKSDLKWMEYTVAGAAAVVADVPAYSWLKGTGLATVCDDDTESWFTAISSLIEDEALRMRQVDLSREHIMRYRLLDDAMPAIFSIWNSALPPLLRRSQPAAWGKVNIAPLTGCDLNEIHRYRLWLKKYNFREIHVEQLAERMMIDWPKQPVFNILCIAQAHDLHRLAESFENMQSQLYPHWRLIVISDTPQPDAIFENNNQLGWLQIESVEDHELLISAVNGVIADIPADWCFLLSSGFRLQPQALLKFGEAAAANSSAKAIYCDHDVVSPMGERFLPKFLPDFSPEYLLSMDYIGSAVAFSVPDLARIGGFRAFPDAYQYDVLLRLMGTNDANTVVHIDDMLLSLPWQQAANRPLAAASRLVALQDHASIHGINAEVTEGLVPGTYHFEYKLSGNPSLSVIIPTKDKLEFLVPCVDSLFNKTGYQNFELILVDNQSEDEESHEYYASLLQRYPGRVKLIEYNQSFNFSEQCNRGVEAACGEYILLLNNDTEIIFDNWLDRMLATAQQPGVGAVGARLLYPEVGKIQHAGILLGVPGTMHAVADHVFEGSDFSDGGYLNRALTMQNYSALTAACLLVSKQDYLAVGGMDAENLKVFFNDVDLCLKLKAKGLRNVYNPFVVLYHHHGKSICRTTSDPRVLLEAAVRERNERETILQRWLPIIAHDPAYNRHLSLRERKMEVEVSRIVSWDQKIHRRKHVLGLPVVGGSGEYRLSQPLSALQQAGKLDGEIVQPSHGILSIAEMARIAPDTLLLHTGINDAIYEALQAYRQFLPGMRFVFGIDDLIGATPEKSNLHDHWKRYFPDAKQRLRKVLKLFDSLIVSTEPLAEFTKTMIDDRRVIPNRLSRAKWGGLQSSRRSGAKPRVGWVGASQHRGDLELLLSVIQETAAEVDWVFMGMCLPQFRPYVAEVHHAVPFEQYPAAVARLNLDLAVAPLEINAFNVAKSNLRLLEYGAMAWPVVCSDIFPYQTNDAPVCRVPNNPAAWVSAIRERVHDLDAAAKEGDALRRWVERDYWLEDHLEDWFAALSG